MAEVRKKKNNNKNENKKNVVNNKKQKNTKEKKSILTKFRIFCNGVVSEFHKVHWPTKDNMLKYSKATIFFIVFFSLFFYLINVLFALIQSLLH